MSESGGIQGARKPSSSYALIETVPYRIVISELFKVEPKLG